MRRRTSVCVSTWRRRSAIPTYMQSVPWERYTGSQLNTKHVSNWNLCSINKRQIIIRDICKHHRINVYTYELKGFCSSKQQIWSAVFRAAAIETANTQDFKGRLHYFTISSKDYATESWNVARLRSFRRYCYHSYTLVSNFLNHIYEIKPLAMQQTPRNGAQRIGYKAEANA